MTFRLFTAFKIWGELDGRQRKTMVDIDRANSLCIEKATVREHSMTAKAQANGCSGDKLRFDYDSVPPSVASFLRGQAERIRRSCTTSIIQIGKALLEAKHHLSHGGFIRWVGAEVGIPARTAQAYMQVAQWIKGKSSSVANLPPSILYILSARSTPGEFVAQFLERHEAGEQVDIGVACAELKARIRAKRLSAASQMKANLFGGQHVPVTEVVQPSMDGGVAVMRAVHILVNRLSASDFMKVKGIMTSKSVLDDPNLAENIETAFLTVHRLTADGQRPTHRAPLHVLDGKHLLA